MAPDAGGQRPLRQAGRHTVRVACRVPVRKGAVQVLLPPGGRLRTLSTATQAGIVAGNGNLISNLKIWENLVLPARYQTATLAQLEAQAHLAVRRRPPVLTVFPRQVDFTGMQLCFPPYVFCSSLMRRPQRRDRMVPARRLMAISPGPHAGGDLALSQA